MGSSYDETIQKAVQAFMLFDLDGDGLITVQEIENVMNSLGQNLSKEEAREIMNKLDTNNSGTVEFREFLKYIRGESDKRISKAALWAAFKANDEEGTGQVSNNRVKEIISELGVDVDESSVSQLLQILDPSSSGTSNYEQYENIQIEISWLF